MSSFDRAQFDRDQARRNERIEKARGPFQRLIGLMSLREYGHGVEAARRIQQAWYAYDEWRAANGQRRNSDEPLALAVRISGATFADQIVAAALPEGMDDRTVRWVAAGLRCPSQPFCTGCVACQTVTSPERVKVST